MSNDQFINQLSERWIKSGLELGDTFLLHSNIYRLLLEIKKKKIKDAVDIIIKSFLNIIDKNGTIIIPLFNFDFTKKNFFCIKSTPSQMGALTERFRNKYSIYRTGHPVYSFGVLGKKSFLFENLNNYSAYSEESPFGILKKIKGKIAVLDLDDQNSMTFYHHVEEINKVNWRYFKKFSGEYCDKNNKTTIREYSIFVRKLHNNVKTQVNPAGELMWKEGIYKGHRPFVSSGLRVVNSNEMFEFVTKIIKTNKAKGLIYSSN